MLSKKMEETRFLGQVYCIDDLVPQNHILRRIDKAIDWNFIYDLVEDKYSRTEGRPSIDPVMLIKIPMIQYLFGIRSMRQTIKEIQVNVAYRWFLGLDLLEPVPHFTTFGKNYSRRFKDTDLFEQIFSNILEQCMNHKFVDATTIFVDSTHVKARANSKKLYKVKALKEAQAYGKQLSEEVNRDRTAHGKKALKEKEENKEAPSEDDQRSTHEIKVSTTDPDSGWFHKGDHKQVFAYSVQTACDIHGWILGYSVNPGNLNDSKTFFSLYEEIDKYSPAILVADAGYLSPAIEKHLLDRHVKPLLPYKRPMTADGFFKKNDFVYDEYYDEFICPNNELLVYSTTNREGYREYKSDPHCCKNCPMLDQCTHSKNHIKIVTRHVWQDYSDQCNDIRYTIGMKELYAKRKETIERIFGTAKEAHGFRYTQMYGKARMQMKVGLTFACMNLKKLANRIA